MQSERNYWKNGWIQNNFIAIFPINLFVSLLTHPSSIKTHQNKMAKNCHKFSHHKAELEVAVKKIG